MRTIALALTLILSFMIPWEGVIRIPGLGSGVKIIGYVLAIFWLAAILITRQLRRPGPFQIAVSIFVLWHAASVFWSEDPNRSMAHVVTWVQLLILVYVWWDLYTTRTRILAGLQAYILGAYVAVGSAIGNYFSGKQFYTHYDRYSAGETNPDGFGFIIALGIPLAWYLAGSINASGIGRVLRFINYAYIPAALLGLALSGTRTALLASVVGMAFGLASLTRLRLAARIAIFVLLTSIILFLLPYVQTLKSFQRLGTTGTELTSGDLNNRTNNWQEGLAAFVEHPLLGIGTNMYPTINSWGKAAHNTFIAFLVELGLIGFLLFASILAIAGVEAWRPPKWESFFWMTILAVWTLGSFTLTWGHRKTTWVFLSLLIASAALAIRREEAVPLLHANEPETRTIPHTQPIT